MNFNLIGEPWIPVLLESDGGVRCRELSLREIFNSAKNVRDLALNPIQRIAVMRLLLCITYAALDGPQDPDDWARCEPEIIAKVLTYLDKWHDRFDLFGDHPFLQVKHLERKADVPCTKLDIKLATGNNHTLFDHQDVTTSRRVEPKLLALNLVTYQCFSTGGLIGDALWGNDKTARSSSHAPCVEGSPLLAVLRGKNVLETIRYNLVPRNVIERYLEPLGHTFGQPVWELDPPPSRSEATKQLSRTFLGRLVPLSRAILLEPDCVHCTLANGVEYPKLPEGIEPMATVVTNEKKQEFSYLRFQPARHPWRDLAAVLTLEKAGVRGAPWALHNVVTLSQTESDRIVDLWIGGITVDRAKYLEVGEWVFSLSLRIFGDRPLETYKEGVQHAETTEARLKNAVKRYCEEVDAPSEGFTRIATLRYWGYLDQHYQQLLDISLRTESLADWKKRCFQAARQSVAEACPAQTPRQIIAQAKAVQSLFARRSERTQSRQKKGVPA